MRSFASNFLILVSCPDPIYFRQKWFGLQLILIIFKNWAIRISDSILNRNLQACFLSRQYDKT